MVYKARVLQLRLSTHNLDRYWIHYLDYMGVKTNEIFHVQHRLLVALIYLVKILRLRISHPLQIEIDFDKFSKPMILGSNILNI